MNPTDEEVTVMQGAAAHQRATGMWPTVDQVAGRVGATDSGRCAHIVRRLVARGYIEQPHRSRPRVRLTRSGLLAVAAAAQRAVEAV